MKRSSFAAVLLLSAACIGSVYAEKASPIAIGDETYNVCMSSNNWGRGAPQGWKLPTFCSYVRDYKEVEVVRIQRNPPQCYSEYVSYYKSLKETDGCRGWYCMHIKAMAEACIASNPLVKYLSYD
jgi:hypothetical protein